MNVTCCNRCVEESEAARGRPNLDLPELSFDLSELTALRVKAIILNVLKDSQDDGAIPDRETLDKRFKITSAGSGSGRVTFTVLVYPYGYSQ